MTATAAPPKSGSSRPPTEGRFFTGQRLGERYRIVECLGRGGMGEVYRADDLELGQPVALKFLPVRLAADERALDRLRGEVRLARSVSHGNVCRVYDLGQADGHVFISMEYIDGENLADTLRRMGPPSREKATELARQICSGLAAAHEAGVLHRDLKPANIMIDGRGRARISDFGLARLAEEHDDAPTLAGTPAYMAPEQLSEGRVSVQTDIYSLGLVLSELFTGRRIIEADSPEDVRALHESGSSASTPTDLDPALERALERCLEADPAARPRSVYEVLAALPGGDPLAAALAAGETPSPALVASVKGTGEIQPWVVALIILVVAGSTFAIAFLDGRTFRFPARATSELAVVAGEIATRELGVVEPPPYDAMGMLRNPLRRDGGPSSYVAWRRWSPRPIESASFHAPADIDLSDPPLVPGSVAVLVDDAGTLIEAMVIVPPVPHDPTGEAELGPLLERAGIDAASVTAERVDPSTLDPQLPVPCDHVTVWRDDASGEHIARAGVYAGQIVAFERIGHAPPLAFVPAVPENSLTDRLLSLVLTATFLFMGFVAVRNLRLGRGDRRGALLAAGVMFIGYVFLEVSAFDLDESLLRQIRDLFEGASGGHAFLHAVQMGILYLAFEPIARRVWPRVLVGWARLVGGRLRDPRIGFEILVGLATGCVFQFGIRCLLFYGHSGQAEGWLIPAFFLQSLVGPARTATATFHAVTMSLFLTMVTVAFIGAGYTVTRRPWGGLVVGCACLSLVSFSIGMSPYIALAAGAVTVFLFARGGVLAMFVFWWALYFTLKPLGTDLTAWYAPFTVFTVLVILLVLAYGVWAALTGREWGGTALRPTRIGARI